ncbi:MAG: hypothetical protein QOK17_2206 [Sphingomonadales bacterium]|jgi:asparagine synthase (glutamine-hydrolysing)|nr:hypothetical protein [Sphingomonadales bacterium]
MCGFFGTASPYPLPEARHVLEGLTDLLAHRGPDDRGSYAEENVFLGHRRLSILDLEGGRQPMSTADGRYILVYNGEIYNFREIRSELEARGQTFLTDGDTEVVLAAYAQWGGDCLTRFRGMFAFAVWDTERREIFLARDRLGIKPLYYALIDGRLVFASEMKSIARHPRFRREPNLAALSSYLSFRTVLGEETVFAGLKVLPPGFCLRFVEGRLSVRRYWDIPRPARGRDLGEDYYLDRLREMLPQIVKSHLVSDVPVGAYLSGGVDSSLLVALMALHHSGPVKTFSVGFDVNGYDEGDQAELVSRHLGTEHRRLVVSADGFIDGMEAMIRHRDQPLSIPHEMALLALSHDLRRDVTVCLSGEGADELFGGYGRVQRSPMDFAKLRLFQRLPAPLQGLIRASVRDPDIRARLALENDVDHFLHVYHWWPMAEKAGVLSEAANVALDGDRAVRTHCREVFEASGSRDPYDRVFYFFEKVHLVNLLDRLDMQSMAASVEARVPFVDHELVEFVSAIPLRHKLRWKSPIHMLRAAFARSEHASEVLDITKYLLRKLADERLPREISRRRKLGFPAPLDAWLGGPLRCKAREVLLDEVTRRRGLFNMPALERLLCKAPSSKYDFHGKRVWMLMNIELWFRTQIDRAS